MTESGADANRSAAQRHPVRRWALTAALVPALGLLGALASGPLSTAAQAAGLGPGEARWASRLVLGAISLMVAWPLGYRWTSTADAPPRRGAWICAILALIGAALAHAAHAFPWRGGLLAGLNRVVWMCLALAVASALLVTGARATVERRQAWLILATAGLATWALLLV